ncbi:hypothetical protein ACVEHT_004962 [Klebsiella quasipneumoniae]
MSQLSFADFFNMTRETADNPPVIQVRPQVAEVVPSVQQMMSEQHSRSRFIRVFKDTGRHLGRSEVFSDFLSLAASKLSLPGPTVNLRAAGFHPDANSKSHLLHPYQDAPL